MTKRLTTTIPLELRPHVRYEIVNNLNGKKYTGITWVPKDRWSNHKTRARREDGGWTIHKAMRKHGIENFSFIIVEHFPNRSSASNAEAIATQTTEYAYNEAPGGLNGAGGSCLWTEEGRRKIIEASKKPRGPMPEWHKEAIRQGHLNNPKVISQETRDKISAAKKGVPKSEEQKQRLRTLRLGVSLTPESIAKRSAKVKGMKKSPETIARMTEGQRIRREKEDLAKSVPPDLKKKK